MRVLILGVFLVLLSCVRVVNNGDNVDWSVVVTSPLQNTCTRITIVGVGTIRDLSLFDLSIARHFSQ